MNKEPHSIVIVYDGPEMSTESVKNVADYIATLLGLNGTPVIYTLDECDMVKAIAKVTLTERSGSVSDAEHAITYIGNMFKDALAAEDIVSFASELATSVATQKITGMDTELLTAVRIIANSNFSTIRSCYRRRYHITQAIYNIIVKIGKRV